MQFSQQRWQLQHLSLAKKHNCITYQDEEGAHAPFFMVFLIRKSSH
ncbi:MAG: hypothetical protein RLZZ65_1216, partial [Bacteroidota bacterium]